jgi:DNA-binding NtrC family response regulator
MPVSQVEPLVDPHAAPGRLLIVDDDPVVLRSLRRTLERSGFEVAVAESGEAAFEAIETFDADVALIDMALPDLPGLEVMQRLKGHDATLECVIFTGYTSAPAAMDSYEQGAIEYFEKPITDWNRFDGVLRRAVRLRRIAKDKARPTPRGVEVGDLVVMLRRELPGTSKVIEDLRRVLLAQVGQRTPVFITGPTGSGKSRLAEVLHHLGGDRGTLAFFHSDPSQPLAERGLLGHVDAAGRATPGLLERVGDGTLVVEDPGLLSAAAQRRLVEALDSAAAVRLVFTSRVELDALVASGRLSEDLAQRVSVRVRVPPLDERQVDLPQLVYSLLRSVNEASGLDVRRVPADVLQVLAGASWTKDNVRGLRAAVEAAALGSRGEALEVEALPAELRFGKAAKGAGAAARPVEMPSWTTPRLPERYRGLSYNDFKERLLTDFMGLYVQDLLETTQNNVTQAARLADLHRPNFRRLMRRYGVEAEDEGDD